MHRVVYKYFSLTMLRGVLLALMLCGGMYRASAQCTATITSESPYICDDAFAPLRAQFTATSYKWYRNNVLITNGATGSTYWASTPGNYYVVAMISGCGGSRQSNTIAVTNITPPSSITPTGTVTICSSSQQILTAPTGTNYSYLWYRNNQVISGANSSTYAATQAGAYNVVVQNAQGCGKMSATTTINTIPGPTIPVLAEPGVVCNATSATLSITPQANCTYSWYYDGSYDMDIHTPTATVTTDGDYFVEVKSTANACVARSNRVYVTFVNRTISIGGPTAFCPGGSSTLTATKSVPNTPFVWKRNNEIITGASAASLVITQPGDYTFEQSDQYCTYVSAVHTVTQTALPTVTISGPAMICAGATATLSTQAVQGYTYQWNLNGAPLDGKTSSMLDTNAAGDYTVTVMSNGCPVTSAIHSIGVQELTVQIWGADKYCNSAGVKKAARLKAEGTTGAAYQWYRDGGLLQSETAPIIDVTIPGDYTVKATLNGCTVTSAVHSVSDFYLAKPRITGIPAWCADSNEPIVLGAADFPQDCQFCFYTWTRDGVVVSEPGPSWGIAPSLELTQGGSYVLTVQTEGCEASSNPFFVRENVINLSLSEGDSFCAGDSLVLTATTEEANKVNWLKDGKVVALQQRTFIVREPGVYRVIATALGCKTKEVIRNITRLQPPAASIQKPAVPAICSSRPVTLQAVTGTGYLYQWEKDGAVIPGATNSSLEATASGVYGVRVTSGICSGLSDTLYIGKQDIITPTLSGKKYFCTGDSTTMSFAPAAGHTYQWLVNDQSAGSANTLKLDQSATVKLITRNGVCIDTLSAIVTELPPPNPITALEGRTAIWAGQRVMLQVKDTTSADGFVWEISPGGHLLYSDAAHRIAQLWYDSAGEYTVKVYSRKGGCLSPAFTQAITVSGRAYASTHIPEEVKVGRDRKPAQQHLVPSVLLSQVAEGQEVPVFDGCTDGKFYVGFQLHYDFGDKNTTRDWSAFLQVALMHGDDVVWIRPLQVDRISETFKTVVFHDTLVSCTDDYRYVVMNKFLEGPVPEENIYLQLLLYKHAEPDFAPSAPFVLECPVKVSPNEHYVTWKFQGDGVQEFDLEWVFIAKDEDPDSSRYNTARKAFAGKEGVGVTIDNAIDYTHQVYYPDGWLWYRARPVGYHPDFPEHRIEGPWTYMECRLPMIRNHEPGKTWQEQTAFVEQGKYRKVMTYFDGTMRERQKLTNLGTENNTLVGESMYDFEGRQSASVMAVPMNGTSLDFQPDFNMFAANTDADVANGTSAQHHKFNYDNYRLPNSVLSGSSGAGRYYSPSNNVAGIHRDFIPNGEGYVYTQNEYLNDGRGRVSRQSGTGKALAMDGNHAIRYYYGEATEDDLVRLFGSNVGKASHYKKNLIVDANGQVTVSYVDQDDRVIATALAGDPPAGVDSLQSFKDLMPLRPVTMDMMSGKNTKEDGVSALRHTVQNEAPNTLYHFEYDLSAYASEVSVFGCQHCVFDLRIAITDPDGRALPMDSLTGNRSGSPYVYERMNLTAENCLNSSELEAAAFDIMLTEIGNYTIVKTLTVHELSFDQIKETISTQASVKAAIDQIKNGYVVDPDDCAICTSGADADKAIDEAIDEIAELDCENIYNQILQRYQASHATGDSLVSVPDDFIVNDSLYCKYVLCGKNKDSDKFEKRVARINTWSEAVAKGYNDLLAIDPFFNQAGLSGATAEYRQSMRDKLNNVFVATVPYDNNGDGLKDGENTFRGTIEQVISPDNAALYINENGQPTHSTGSGRHVMYLDLMNKRSELGETTYREQIDLQRWALYKAFYLNAKRDQKLAIPEYRDCPKAAEELAMVSNLPTQPDSIIAWSEQNGLGGEVTQPQIANTLVSLRNACDVEFSQADSDSLATHLTKYFNSNRQNFFKLIFVSDLRTNGDLIEVQRILNNYSCSLDSVAEVDPKTCVRDTIVSLPPKLIPAKTTAARQSLSFGGENLSNGTRTAVVVGQVPTLEARIHNEAKRLDSLYRVADQLVTTKYAVTSANLVETDREVKPAARVSAARVAAATPAELQAQWDALLELFESTGGPDWWRNKTGWINAFPGPPESLSGWKGVTVDASGYVTQLLLANNGLRGTIPQSLANLTHLTNLTLNGNDLSGPLPTELTGITSLSTVNVQTNYYTFSDLLPFAKLYTGSFYYSDQARRSNDAQSLIINRDEALVLRSNIDTSLEPACEFQWFTNGTPVTDWTAGNGTAQLFNVAPTDFQIYYSQIRHPLLPDLILTANYRYATVYDCTAGHQQERDILMALYNSTKGAQWTDATNWGTSEPLSQWNGVEVDLGGYVTKLNLNDNNLSGTIPSAMAGLCHVKYIQLQNNALTGGIPEGIGQMSHLEGLDVSGNNLGGNLPNFESALDLKYLNLTNNHFYGPIRVQDPDDYDWGDLSTGIFIGNNNFTFADFVWLKPDDTNYWECNDGGACFTYAPQAEVDQVRTIAMTTGVPSELTTSIDRSTDPASKYQWFKYVNGVNDIPLNEESVNGHTFPIASPSASNNGRYYYTIRNDNAVNVTLKSKLITVRVSTPGNIDREICLEYDTTNATIRKFAFVIDWNKQIQKCLDDAAEANSYLSAYAIDKLMDDYVTEYRKKFQTQCLSRATETFEYTYTSKEHHYTLYYFDQAGNLTQSVPPEGVKPLTAAQVKAFKAGAKIEPAHTLITHYQYASLNNVLWQKTPDAGESNFFYNDKTQLRASQNAQQNIDNRYGYMKYDEQGRVVEAGELYTNMNERALRDSLQTAAFPRTGVAGYQMTDRAISHFDFADDRLKDEFPQHYLRSRISWVEVLERGTTDTITTHYSYDIHGNVTSYRQGVPGLGGKRTDYRYDLVSGRVNYVFYEYGKPDQFAHEYEYDADNRIIAVRTSVDRFIWNLDARYTYYGHGPMARAELGNQRSQGLDYYYTLQGWTKGVNQPYADDPGLGNLFDYGAGKDVFAYTLGYYEGDYKAIGTGYTSPDVRDGLWNRSREVLGHNGLHTSNVSWMITDLAAVGKVKGDRQKGMQAMLYRYDQLNRLTTSRSLTNYAAGSGFAARDLSPKAYDEAYSYDGNGNILALQRRNAAAALWHDYDYRYYKGTNKLRGVLPIERDTLYSSAINSNTKLYRDITVQGSNAYAVAGTPAELRATENVFIHSQFDAAEGSDFAAYIPDDGPFIYDAIGNLVADQEDGVKIEWTPTGKVRQVKTKNDSVVVRFRYDATGNRIEKRIEKYDTTMVTRYLRNAGGDVMAIYSDTTVVEQPIYGSGRVGMYKGGIVEGTQRLGRRNYELANHLGNVLTVVTDGIGMLGDETWAEVINTSDYYPFGLAMEDRGVESYVSLPDTTQQLGKPIAGLLASYPLDGNATDVSGNGLNGTIKVATLTTDNEGDAGKAYLFNGSTSCIRLPDSSMDSLAFVQNTGRFTITAFIKLSDIDARSSIFASLNATSGKGFTFMYENDSPTFGLRQLRFSSNYGVSGKYNLALGAKNTIDDQEWHHVAVVGDGTTIRFYVDGVPDGVPSTIKYYSTGSSSRPGMIGGTPHTTSNNTVLTPMHGSIDEVQVFKRPLTQQEIQRLMRRNLEEVIGEDHEGGLVIRNWDNEYRYGFNGKEKNENEFGATTYDYGYRIYNPKISKFLSVDPLTKSYPMLTPYQFASNTPIMAIDLDGLESYMIVAQKGMGGEYEIMTNTMETTDSERIKYMIDIEKYNYPKAFADVKDTDGITILIDEDRKLVGVQRVEGVVIEREQFTGWEFFTDRLAFAYWLKKGVGDPLENFAEKTKQFNVTYHAKVSIPFLAAEGDLGTFSTGESTGGYRGQVEVNTTKDFEKNEFELSHEIVIDFRTSVNTDFDTGFDPTIKAEYDDVKYEEDKEGNMKITIPLPSLSKSLDKALNVLSKMTGATSAAGEKLDTGKPAVKSDDLPKNKASFKTNETEIADQLRTMFPIFK